MLDDGDITFAFGPFRLLTAERRLENAGEPVRLGGRALDLLIVLVARAGEVVSNDDLLSSVWHGVTVGDNSLRFHIKNIRRALGSSPEHADYITNVSGRGYCFTARIERLGRSEAPGSAAESFDTRSNLPARTATIVGRANNIETISQELLRRRLVTIAGPGGIGKTTLAIATAEALRADFGDAVFFVDLSPIENPALVMGAVAAVLGRVQRAEEPMDALLAYLRHRRLLIVVDNCEHVIDEVAALAGRIVPETVGTHMLITSREPLRIPSERVHRLLPLECPPVNDHLSAEAALSHAAVQLFVDRAAASFDGFIFNDALAPVVGEICRRLDGIPLALELAAARVEFLGVPGLARALNDMFAVLTQGRRFALPRHQTLRAALDWSYQLLTPAEQATLQRIAIFRSAFTLESALAIVQDATIDFATAVDAMGNLVEKSILTADRTSEIAQYRLLEATRIYASEKLASDGGRPEAARRHARHHLQLIENAPANWESDAGKAWLRLYAGRIDDFRAALDWCFSGSGDPSIGFRLMIASARLWFQLSLTLECRDRAEIALSHLADAPESDTVTEMQLQVALGHALWYSASDADRLERAFRRALNLAEQVGDAHVQLQALWGLWASRRVVGRYREAQTLATQYDANSRASGDAADVLLGDRILGLTQHYLGNQSTARALSERVLDVARRTGNALNTEFQLSPEIAATTILARALWLQGLPDQAASRLDESIEAAQRSDHWFSMYYALCFAGCPLALWVGDLAQAQRYLDMTVNRAAADRWRGCWAAIVKLRQSGDRDALIAASLEPRVDLQNANRLLALAASPTVPMPQPDDSVGDGHWSLPEILRVNAELLLWHDAPDAAASAEEALRHALEMARQQATLSWELRAAMSLGRLWHRGGRVAEARDLVAATYDRFTEGFGTADLAAARRLITEWS